LEDVNLSFIIGAIKIIFLLGFLVLIHEGGHFLVAKKCNVKVLEFSIGFGKKIYSKQGKETMYSIRMIPLGGYVRMLGEEEAVEDDRAFNKMPIWKRLLIVLAGPVVNITFGLFVFWILASIYNHSMYSGLIVLKNYIVLLAKSLTSLFSKSSTAEVVGPVGISEMIVNTSGWFDFIYLLAVISVSLGITNLLPIPALDGGKILILIIELIRRKPMKQETEMMVTAIGMFILLTIAVFVTAGDIGNLI
jgi:regulator of sigma E protease